MWFNWKAVNDMHTLMPASMGLRSAKGTSLVAISQRMMAKLHMSAALVLMSLAFLHRAAE